ncbi:MAG: Chaperone protein DnaJ [Alphaproteobacteria bacterium MarineAlpha11_Bin1]|nr:MAG: Chaperone protein DnaJ [Alphaproteobacteria bacterium MarineAlpha11_Bin1]|tara:strand:+ start:12512 stop:13675 length:1164 start_codon:yes stop_codon:yes gene_type:complete
MAKQDYYETLGVDRSANEQGLKSAYRKLAMKFHPDRNPDDAAAEAKFKEVSEAYDVLKDAEKRAAYDQFGHAAFEGGGAGAGGGGFDFGGGGGFADIFDEMFGDFVGGGRGQAGGRGRTGASRGSDLRYNMQISMEDAFKGRETQIRVQTAVTCDECNGSGAAKGSQPTVCGTCKGRGKVRAQQGFFTVERTCPTCNGAGQVIADPCHNCSGAGRVQKEKTLKVTIPAGVEDGTRIRLAGEGEAGVQGGGAGDLYIFIAVAPHKLFRREEADLHIQVPIPMATAALGGSIEVPTIEGKRAKVTIPKGAQSSHQFRLRNKGMSVLRSQSRGDMYIDVVVETPVNLSKRQEELLREFQGEKPAKGQSTTSPESEGFFSRVKELWDDLTD